MHLARQEPLPVGLSPRVVRQGHEGVALLLAGKTAARGAGALELFGPNLPLALISAEKKETLSSFLGEEKLTRSELSTTKGHQQQTTGQAGAAPVHRSGLPSKMCLLRSKS